MEIVRMGDFKEKKRRKFACIYCHSVLIAEQTELHCIGHQYNESIYEFYCPVCHKTRTVDDSMMEKVE